MLKVIRRRLNYVYEDLTNFLAGQWALKSNQTEICTYLYQYRQGLASILQRTQQTRKLEINSTLFVVLEWKLQVLSNRWGLHDSWAEVTNIFTKYSEFANPIFWRNPVCITPDFLRIRIPSCDAPIDFACFEVVSHLSVTQTQHVWYVPSSARCEADPKLRTQPASIFCVYPDVLQVSVLLIQLPGISLVLWLLLRHCQPSGTAHPKWSYSLS